jgi:hypothetical protein
MRWDFSGLIPIALGIYVLLAVFRVIRLSKNPEANELWLRKFGRMMKILGPIIVLAGLLQLFGLFR